MILRSARRVAIRRGNDKLTHFAEDDRVELYDLRDDVGEQNDLSELRADVATELRSLLEQQFNEMDAGEPLPSIERLIACESPRVRARSANSPSTALT
ncbi:MAG: hypothetical protein AAGG48_19375 [Planctomycetota bacterium]